MNLLARIVSHGFSMALVFMVAVVFMYRGELFPEWLPEESGLVQSVATPGMQAGADNEDGTDVPGRKTETTESMRGGVDSRGMPPPQVVAVEASNVPEGETLSDSPPQDQLAIPETSREVPGDEVDMEAGGVSAQGLADTGELDDTVSELPEPSTDARVDTAGNEETATSIPSVEAAADEAAETVTPEPESPATPGSEGQSAGIPTVAGREEGNAAEAEMNTTPSASALQDPAIGTSPEGGAGMATSPEEASGKPSSTEQVLPEQQLASASSPGMSEGSVSEGMDDESLQLLAAAREAFWLRDYETAERNYRELTRLQPDNPDAYGELGNIYFSQGKWDEAGVAYYEAAIRMVEGKRLDDARNLLNIIRGLDAEKGAELEQYILSSAGQSS